MRLFGLLGLFFAIAFGADGEAAAIDLTTTWAGILSLIIFVVGYFFIAAEENFHIDKAKPAIFIGTFMFLLIGVYMLINGCTFARARGKSPDPRDSSDRLFLDGGDDIYRSTC